MPIGVACQSHLNDHRVARRLDRGDAICWAVDLKTPFARYHTQPLEEETVGRKRDGTL